MIFSLRLYSSNGLLTPLRYAPGAQAADIGLFGTERIMTIAKGFTIRVEEFFPLWYWREGLE